MEELQVRYGIAELLDAPPCDLTPDAELDNFPGYDSVARLSLITFLSDAAGRPFDFATLQNLRTYGDILTALGIASDNGHRG